MCMYRQVHTNTPCWVCFCCLCVYSSKNHHLALDTQFLGEAASVLRLQERPWETFPLPCELSANATSFGFSSSRSHCWGGSSQQASWSSDLSAPYSFAFSKPWTKVLCVQVSTGAGLPMACWFPHCVQLWFSVMGSISGEERPLWWQVGAALFQER